MNEYETNTSTCENHAQNLMLERTVAVEAIKRLTANGHMLFHDTLTTIDKVGQELKRVSEKSDCRELVQDSHYNHMALISEMD